MATIKVPPGSLGVTLADKHKRMAPAIKAGITIAAERARSYLVRQSPVYQGAFKNAWTAKSHLGAGSTVASVVNDAPYAGVIELGARPHGVSEEGRAAIAEWVRRKGVLTATVEKGKRKGSTRRITAKEAGEGGKYESEIKEVVDAIVWKLMHEGQEGLHIVEKALPKIGKWTAQEILSQVRKLLSTPGGSNAP